MRVAKKKIPCLWLFSADGKVPWDIVFQAGDATTCGGAAPCTLNYEVEYYDAVHGQLIAWVNIPSITNGTVIYMYYGNSSVTSSQANPTGVWDSKYKGVWHFPNGTSLTVSDSTSNANSTTNNGVSATTGQIDGAGKFVSASSQYISVSPISSLGGASKAVLSAWLKRNASGSKLEVGEDNYPTSRFNMQVWSGNIVYLAAENASFDYGTFTLSDSDTSWHKIDMVYDGTQPTNDTRLLGYLDGVKQTLSFANTIPATLGTAGAFVIGYAPASGPASTVSLWIYDGA